MKRCKHLNCVITEEGTWYTMHFYKNGNVDYHNNEPGDYERIFVQCRDCGMDRMYRVGRLPQWLKVLWDAGFEPDEWPR
jgi:hypothetical protein